MPGNLIIILRVDPGVISQLYLAVLHIGLEIQPQPEHKDLIYWDWDKMATILQVKFL